MDMPGSVLIGHQRWEIVEDDFSDDDSIDGFMYGQTQPRRLRIRINPNQAPGQARDTLLHEILHGAFYNFPHEMSDDDEEKFIRMLTPHLMSVLQFNPDVVEFLTEDSDG